MIRERDESEIEPKEWLLFEGILDASKKALANSLQFGKLTAISIAEQIYQYIIAQSQQKFNLHHVYISTQRHKNIIYVLVCTHFNTHELQIN